MKLRPSVAISLIILSPGISVQAREDPSYNPDPSHSSRPRNVTDLAYWLYGWTGSYYNGTTTFHFTPLTSEDPVDDEDESEKGKVCPAFANKTSSFSFDSLVAITRPDAASTGWSNPLVFSLKSWLPGANLLPAPIAGLFTEPFPSDQIDSLTWHLESVEPPQRDTEASRNPRWNLTLDKPRKPDGINTLFTFSARPIYYPPGYYPVPIAGLQLNMSTCRNVGETWWGASFLTLNDTLESRDRFVPNDPSFRVAFDNKSASFQYSGFYFMNTDPGNDVLDNGDPDRNTLFGAVRIEFLGSIDPLRSDILVESSEKKPAWVPVIGFGNGTGTIDAGSGAANSAPASLKGQTPGLLGVLVVGVVSLAWWCF